MVFSCTYWHTLQIQIVNERGQYPDDSPTLGPCTYQLTRLNYTTVLITLSTSGALPLTCLFNTCKLTSPHNDMPTLHETYVHTGSRVFVRRLMNLSLQVTGLLGALFIQSHERTRTSIHCPQCQVGHWELLPESREKWSIGGNWMPLERTRTAQDAREQSSTPWPAHSCVHSL
jgi:hypothetical protein